MQKKSAVKSLLVGPSVIAVSTQEEAALNPAGIKGLLRGDVQTLYIPAMSDEAKAKAAPVLAAVQSLN